MINDFFNILLPQFNLAVFVILQLILSVFVSPKHHEYARLLSCIAVIISVCLLTTVQVEPQYFGLHNSYMSDSYTLLFHFIILTCGFFIILLTKNLISKTKQNSYTFHAILLTAILSAMNIVSANDFLTLFVSVESMSFATYFILSAKQGYRSKEAAFKYLIMNAVSTGVFLFGVSYLYGITSDINFSEIYEYTANNEPSLIFGFACIMIILGLFAKLAIFPFANWIIDVFHGCETSGLAFLSAIPKIALVGIICRLLVFPFQSSFELTLIIAIVSIITGLWANCYAIREKNIKIILACSSSANISYMTLAACMVSVNNLAAVIFYLICYLFMDIAAWTFLNIAERNSVNDNIENFKGYFQKNKGLVIAYTISIVGLAGLPVTSGFIAKIYLFSSIASSGILFLPFLIAILFLTIIALYYYFKIIRPLYEEHDKNTDIKTLKAYYSQKFVIYICTALTILIGIYPEKFIELCHFIAYNI